MLLVVGLDLLSQSVLPVLQHFYQHLKFLLKLRDGAFFFRLELVFDFSKLLGEDTCFLTGGVDLFLEDLGAALEHLHQSRLAHIANVMPFVLKDDALGANIDLIIFAEEFGALVGVLEAVLFSRLLLRLFLLFLLLGAHVLLTVQVVQNREILYQLLHVRAKVGATSGAGEDVAGAEVHEAVLAEGVAAGEDARNFLLVIILIKADRARHFHPVLLVCRAQRY